jgi:hypothetical protein
VKELYTVTQRATKVARSNTKVLLIEITETIKSDFGGFFMFCLGFLLRQNDNLKQKFLRNSASIQYHC